MNPQHAIGQMGRAIELLIDKDLTIPALTLIYSLIDCMAWATRPEDQPDVHGKDFINWVERYMLPAAPALECTAADLYAARCGILHSLTTESGHVRRGKARAIYYSWGTADLEKLKKSINITGQNAVAMRITDLQQAVFTASSLFWNAASSDPELSRLIKPRLNQWISSYADLPEANES